MKRKRSQSAVLNSNVINIDPRFNNHRYTDRIEEKRKKVQIYPKNLSQENYLLKLNDAQKMIVFAIGPAGTGKTLLAVQYAIEQLKKSTVDKIIITRPAVSVDEQHGFLPGDLNQKMEPWTRPIMDVFMDNYSTRECDNMMKDGVIEVSPLAYMRGRTFKKAIVIADEMQNATSNQMKMLLTRLGTDSKMIVTGDLQQADRPSNNGLLEFLQLFNNFKDHRYVDLCHFTAQDIERHEAVKEILAIYGDQ